jgi:uncharacterized protein (TIGR00299 family) protein
MHGESGQGKIVVIDGQAAGVAGDMFLAALIDLGADTNIIVEAIKTLEAPEYGYGNVQVKVEKVNRGDFPSTYIDTTAESTSKKTGQQLISTVEKAVRRLGLSEKAQKFASNTVRTLVGAEAAVHGDQLADAHLHEVGLVDTPAEIVGCAVALDNLGLLDAEMYALPISVGGGTIKFSHGTVPVPAPATLKILQSKNFPFKGGPIEAELATPTGAAIIVNLADKVTTFYPALKPIKVGHGAGTKEFKETPNVLRITVGTPLNLGLRSEAIAVLETNLDDVTGEVIGYTIKKLLEEGAKDVSVIPMSTKKNRPGHIIKVIADTDDSERLSQVLMEQTGTLGVRAAFCERHVLNREIRQLQVHVKDSEEHVNVKVTRNSRGQVVHVKPEYEDLKRIADKTHTPLREVSEAVTVKAKEAFQKGACHE